MRSYWDKVRRYFWFSKEEFKGILLVVLVFGFVFSMQDWFGKGVALPEIVRSIGIGLVIAAVSVFVMEAGHRFAALYIGFKVETKIWWYGLMITLILGILSGGRLVWLGATGIWIHHLAVHRLGAFRYGPNTEPFAWIAAAGPLANIILATVVKNIELYVPVIQANPVIAQKIFFFNWLLAGLNLLPIPPLAGSRLFFYSRLWYAFIAGSVIGYLFLTAFQIYSYIFALAIGGLAWLVFYIFFERVWGK